MNFAHIHLMLNHIPIISIPVTLIFFIYAFIKSNSSLQRFCLVMLIGLSLATLLVFLTGEPAEDSIKHLQGISKSLIENHEEAAKNSLILTFITAMMAFIAMYYQKDNEKHRLVSVIVIGVTFLSVLSLAYTAYLGGKLRHTEFQEHTSLVRHSKNKFISNFAMQDYIK